MRSVFAIHLLLALTVSACGGGFAHAAERPFALSAEPYDAPAEAPLQRLAHALPPRISDDLDLEGWIWLRFVQNNEDPHSQNVHDEMFSLALTKSFNQRVAITVQGNLIDANDEIHCEFGQIFASALLSEDTQTILTAGQFHANFAVSSFTSIHIRRWTPRKVRR